MSEEKKTPGIRYTLCVGGGVALSKQGEYVPYTEYEALQKICNVLRAGADPELRDAYQVMAEEFAALQQQVEALRSALETVYEMFDQEPFDFAIAGEIIYQTLKASKQ